MKLRREKCRKGVVEMIDDEKQNTNDELIEASEPEPIKEEFTEPVADAPVEDYSDKVEQIAPKRTYRTGTKIAAFIFFVITLGVFIVYEIFAYEFLFNIFAKGPDAKDFGEAMGAIFGGIFGLIMTFIFGAAQLPENIISIILFARLRGRSDKNWENVLFTVMFALSIVLLAVMILTFALFFIMTASN